MGIFGRHASSCWHGSCYCPLLVAGLHLDSGGLLPGQLLGRCSRLRQSDIWGICCCNRQGPPAFYRAYIRCALSPALLLALMLWHAGSAPLAPAAAPSTCCAGGPLARCSPSVPPMENRWRSASCTRAQHLRRWCVPLACVAKCLANKQRHARSAMMPACVHVCPLPVRFSPTAFIWMPSPGGGAGGRQAATGTAGKQPA